MRKMLATTGLTVALFAGSVVAMQDEPDSCSDCAGDAILAAYDADEICQANGGSPAACLKEFMCTQQRYCAENCSPCTNCGPEDPYNCEIIQGMTDKQLQDRKERITRRALAQHRGHRCRVAHRLTLEEKKID